MRYLLDTHIILWLLAGSDKLPKVARQIIEDPDNTICYSAVSPWELEIKHLKEPDRVTLSGKGLIFLCEQVGITDLPVNRHHIGELENVSPADPNNTHKDPFDRMLLAQARAENMVLITHDRKFKAYDDPHLLVC